MPKLRKKPEVPSEVPTPTLHDELNIMNEELGVTVVKEEVTIENPELGRVIGHNTYRKDN